MIDIHVHILPRLDDGAQTIEQAVAMAERAVADQVKCIVATPHSNLWDELLSRQAVEEGVEALRQVLEDKGIGLALLPGLEVHIGPTTAEQAQSGQVFALNNSRYILVELPLQAYPRYTEQVLFQLQLGGFTPVLAHPERYPALQEDVNLLYKLVERGALGQMTAGSIVGHFGRRVQQAAEGMLARNLVHVIASDAHDAESRPPVLSPAVERVAKLVGREAATAMVTSVPEAIVNNGKPRLPEPIPAKQKKGWALWR